jgi:hypothetical protein
MPEGRMSRGSGSPNDDAAERMHTHQGGRVDQPHAHGVALLDAHNLTLAARLCASRRRSRGASTGQPEGHHHTAKAPSGPAVMCMHLWHNFLWYKFAHCAAKSGRSSRAGRHARGLQPGHAAAAPSWPALA